MPHPPARPHLCHGKTPHTQPTASTLALSTTVPPPVPPPPLPPVHPCSGPAPPAQRVSVSHGEEKSKYLNSCVSSIGSLTTRFLP